MFATANDITFHVGKLTKKEWQKAERISGEGTNNDLEWLRFSQGNNGELFMLNLPVSSTVFKGNLKSLIKISANALKKQRPSAMIPALQIQRQAARTEQESESDAYHHRQQTVRQRRA